MSFENSEFRGPVPTPERAYAAGPSAPRAVGLIVSRARGDAGTGYHAIHLNTKNNLSLAKFR